MERILVGVDLSETSRLALELALKLACASGSALRILHVTPLLGPGPGAPEEAAAEAAVTAELEQQFRDFVQAQLEPHQPLPVPVDVEIRCGTEHEELLTEAGWHGVSLVVIGSHGRSKVERIFLGSVSGKVVRRAKVPVLVVHGPGGLPAKILVAVELGESTELVLRTARRWQKLLGAQLSVAHVLESMPRLVQNVSLGQEILPLYWDRQEDIRHSVEMAVQKVFPQEPRPVVHFLEGEPYRELYSLVQAEKFDLVVIGAHEKHGILDLGDTALRIANRFPCSVLVARPVPEPLSEGC